MLISQALIAILPKSASRPAVEYLGKSQTFKEMADQVGRLSYLLLKEVGAGKRVALIASNSPATILTLFALSNIRGLLIPIHPELSDDDTAQWIYDTKPDVLLVTSDYTSRIQDLIRRRGISLQVIEIDKKRGGEYATSYIAPSDQQPTDKDPILLLRTSGTAGKFKYALFSHNQTLAAVSSIKRLYKATGSDRFLTTLNWSNPFAFVHGMLFPFLTGNLIVIDHGHEPSALINFIHQSKVTRLIGFPDFFQKLLLLCHSRQVPLRGVQSVTVGYGSLNQEFTKIFEMLKTQVLNCYGQTEGLWTICMSEYFGQSDTPSQTGVLRPLTGLEYKVIDRNGDEVTGKGPREGQLAVSTPTLMLGYDYLQTKNEQDAKEEAKKDTQEVIRGTWLYTGDLVKLDGVGQDLTIRFLNRKDGLKQKLLINSYDPSAIHQALSAIPGIQDVYVFQHQSLTHCAVVLAPESTLSSHQIIVESKASLTPKNIPKVVKILPALPRAVDGSIELKALLEACGLESPSQAA